MPDLPLRPAYEGMETSTGPEFRWKHLPQHSGAAMAQYRPLSNCEDSGYPPRLIAETSVSDRVNATMEVVQAP